MHGFTFELQSVLDHRARLERARQGEVASLESARLAVESRIRSIQQSMSDSRRQLRDALSGATAPVASQSGAPPAPQRVSVRIDAARLAANAGLHDLIRLQRAAIELAGAHQRLAAARTRLLAATVERKAVETLKNRRYLEWKRLLARRENAELDDLAVMRAARSETT